MSRFKEYSVFFIFSQPDFLYLKPPFLLVTLGLSKLNCFIIINFIIMAL